MSSWKRKFSTPPSLVVVAFHLKKVKIGFGAVIGVASTVFVRIWRAFRVREITHTTQYHWVKKANTRKSRRRNRIAWTVGKIENETFFQSFYKTRLRSTILNPKLCSSDFEIPSRMLLTIDPLREPCSAGSRQSDLFLGLQTHKKSENRKLSNLIEAVAEILVIWC